MEIKKKYFAKVVFSVKTPCDSGDISLLGQAKKIAGRMLLPHHAYPLPYLKNMGVCSMGKN